MKKWILVLIFLLVPALSFAASKDDFCYTSTNKLGQEVVDTISVSKDNADDLFSVDFEPTDKDAREKYRVKFSVQLTPETAAARVNMVCNMWNGSTNLTATKPLKEGNALTGPFDFDVIIHQKTTSCNFVVVDGGTQDWTAEICKTYNSSR